MTLEPRHSLRVTACLQIANAALRSMRLIGFRNSDSVTLLVGRSFSPIACQRRVRANARISSISNLGCSMAAKCPPRGISVQRCTLNSRST